MNFKLALAASIAALSASASAHDRVDVLTGYIGTFEITTLELDAGGAITVDAVPLASITPFTITSPRCIERIGNEVWVGTGQGLVRYGGTPLAYIDRAFDGEVVVAIARTSFGATLSTTWASAGTRNLIDIDPAGGLIRRVDTGFWTYTDVEAFQNGYLGAANDTLLRLDANYDVLYEFAPGATAVAWQNNTGYFPERITMLEDGRIAVSAGTCVAILQEDETVEFVDSVAPAEMDVLETGGGLLLVPSASGLGLLDPDTVEFFPRTATIAGFLGRAFGSRYSTIERGATGRTCTATPNSTGAAARVHLLADASATARKLSIIATDLPAGTTALPIHGRAAFDGPLGDGRLCVSPIVPGLRRGPVGVASSTGSFRTDFDFITPELGAGFVAGTTWFHQVLYRDTGPSGLDATDAVFVTYEP